MTVSRVQIASAGAEVVQLVEAYENQAWKVFARFLDADGATLLRAGFPSANAWELRVFDIAKSEAAPLYQLLYQANTGIESSLGTTGWRIDTIGYSFVYTFTPSSQTTFRPRAGRTYRFEFLFHATAGDFPLVVVYQPKALMAVL